MNVRSKKRSSFDHNQVFQANVIAFRGSSNSYRGNYETTIDLMVKNLVGVYNNLFKKIFLKHPMVVLIGRK